MKKKKREQPMMMRLLILALTGVILLVAVFVASLLIETDPTSSFATEPWLDPHVVCSTEWVFPEEDHNNPELIAAFAEQDLPVNEVKVISEIAMPSCIATDGSTFEQRHHDILIWYAANAGMLADDEQLGHVIHELIGALSSTSISQIWQGSDILSITFVLEDATRRQWRMNYVQAFRAYEAGLTGLDLFALGIVR